MKSKTINADSKFHSDAPFTNVDIVFKSESEIEGLIEALKGLLSDGNTKLVELDDIETESNLGLGATVYFHRPGHQRDETDELCLKSAEDLIMRYQRN